MRARLLLIVRQVFRRLSRLWRLERPGGQAVITLRQPVLLVAFLLLLIWYLGRPSSVAALSVAALGGLLATSYGWTRRLALGVSAHRRLNYAAVQVGDEIEETVTLSNASFLPILWAEFVDHSSIPGYSLSSVRVADGRSVTEWRAHAVCTQRGNYRFGPWELLTGDPFGLFQVSLVSGQQEEILVYPPLAALPEQLIPRGRSQGNDRPLVQPLSADSTSAFSARPYQPGDPLRRIHWPTTARHAASASPWGTASPYVKMFDPEASATLWLIPDLDAAVQRGEGPASTLETTIILLASLADRLLEQRLSVGLIAFTSSPEVVLPARGRPQFWQILRRLAGLQPSTLPLAGVLSQARGIVSGRQRLVIATPSLHPEWIGQLHRFGAALHRSAAEVILLDPHSFDPALRAPLGGAASHQEVGACVSLLASLGVPARVLRQGDIRPQAASYGELSRWEFQTLGTGRAFARRAPRKLQKQPPPAPGGRPLPPPGR
jgi:uncharacterized protein (DUF58 family)